ncbi:AEC family transporter [Roseobacteraceae bacterium S113]
MNLALTVLNITAPVFLLAAIGFGWVKLGFEYRVQFVTRLAMTLSVPCLIFTALVETDIEPSALSDLLLASVAAYGVITIVGWIAVLVAGLERRTYLAPLIFGNTGNLGLPLALFAFGPEGLSLAVVVFAVMAIWSFTFGIWLVAEGGSPLAVIKEPLVGATLAGALFMWQGWGVPVALFNTLDLIGQMAIPLMLITLGVAVARLKPQRIGQAIVLSIIKVVLCAGLAWLVAQGFGLAPVPAAVLVLQVATPVAVTSYLLAEKYGADSDAVAGLVVVSTLLSVIYLPILLALLL